MKIRAHLEVETGLPLGVDLLGPKQQMCRLRWPRRLVHERISDHEQCERNEERGGRAHEGDEGATLGGSGLRANSPSRYGSVAGEYVPALTATSPIRTALSAFRA